MTRPNGRKLGWTSGWVARHAAFGSVVLLGMLGCLDQRTVEISVAGPGSVESESLCFLQGQEVPATCSGTVDVFVCLTPSDTSVDWGLDCNCLVPPTRPGCDQLGQCQIDASDWTLGTISCTADFCDTTRWTLGVTVDGPGAITGSNGIRCGSASSCDAITCEGDEITLTATPRTGSGAVFTGWSGDADCLAFGNVTTVTMDGPRSCTARFVQPRVEVSVTGSGTVVSPPQIRDCRAGSPTSACTRTTASGPEATLTAIADPGAALVGWGGDCTGTAASVGLVLLDELNTCTALFTTVPIGSGSGVTEIVSLADDETLLAGGVFPAVDGLDASADLSVAAFEVPGRSALARDRTLGTTQEIRPPDSAGFAGSGPISLSADGRVAAYQAQAEIVPGSPMAQVYLRDLASVPAASPERISLHDPLEGIGQDPDGGGELANVSGNGRYVVYLGVIPFMRDDPSSGPSYGGVVVHDTCVGAAPSEACTPGPVAVSYDDATGEAHSPGFPSTAPRISRDGRVVLYHAFSSSLGMEALFLHDRDADADGVYDEPGATSTVPVVTDLAATFGPFFLDASGRYVGYRSADPALPDNANPPPSGRAFLHDTCFEAPGPCTPSDTLLFWQSNGVPDYQPLSFAGGAYFDFGTQLTDVSGSGRFVAFESEDRRYYDANTTGWTFGRLGFMRDTCIGAPPGCVPTNRLVSRRTNGTEVPLAEKAVRTSDDGTQAVLFGQRNNVVSQPNGTLFEVLLSVTGFVPELGETPTITGRSPTTAPAGSSDFLLTIHGTGFVPGATATWDNGTVDLATTFVSAQKLQARVTTADLSVPGTVHLVRVRNPAGDPSDPVIVNTTAP